MPDGAPNSKAEIRDRFRLQIDKLAATGLNIAAAARLEEQLKWMQLDLGDWDGDLDNQEDIGKAFSRDENAQDYKDAIKDSESPGTVGDLMASQLQGEFLACQERAFRARHRGSVRSQFHAAARRDGHGNEKGVLKRSVANYVESILKAAKDA